MMTRTAIDRTEEPAKGPPDPVDLDDRGFRMAVTDLQPGRNAEVVLFNDSAFRDVVLESAVVDVLTGVVHSHVTAEGIDVSGYAFVRFADGLVVYHAPDTRVRVIDLG